MFEIIGFAIGLAIYGVKYAAILAWYVIKYCTPVFLVIFLFFMGGELGSSIYESKMDAWTQEQIDDVTHTVTIDWQNGKSNSQITVREDCQWDINGTYDYYDYYSSSAEGLCDAPELPGFATQSEKEFLGLAEFPWGGRLVVDAYGNALMTVTSDTTLYAQWGK